MSDLVSLRRRNALVLFQQHAEAALARGEPAKGLEQAFAARMEISPSMWSQIKSSRAISDRLARQLEHHAGQSPGWLDEEHESRVPDPAEEKFLALARRAWRAGNAKEKRALAQWLRERLAEANDGG